MDSIHWAITERCSYRCAGERINKCSRFKWSYPNYGRSSPFRESLSLSLSLSLWAVAFNRSFETNHAPLSRDSRDSRTEIFRPETRLRGGARAREATRQRGRIRRRKFRTSDSHLRVRLSFISRRKRAFDRSSARREHRSVALAAFKIQPASRDGLVYGRYRAIRLARVYVCGNIERASAAKYLAFATPVRSPRSRGFTPMLPASRSLRGFPARKRSFRLAVYVNNVGRENAQILQHSATGIPVSRIISIDRRGVISGESRKEDQTSRVRWVRQTLISVADR